MIAVLLVLGLVTVWWFWPQADRHFCHRLQAIRAELIERRSKSTAQEARDLKTFAEKAISELDARIPALEMKAKTGHQESMYLLRASRDCLRPLLAEASETRRRSEKGEGEAPAEPQTEGKHGSAGTSPSRNPVSQIASQNPLEENLDYFLWALKNYYDGYQPLEALPAQTPPPTGG